jgi:hypothetical protein
VRGQRNDDDSAKLDPAHAERKKIMIIYAFPPAADGNSRGRQACDCGEEGRKEGRKGKSMESLQYFRAQSIASIAGK